MKVREARADDIQSIVELWKEFMDFHRARDPFFQRAPHGPERFAVFVGENIDHPDWLVLVATDDDLPIGYCMAAILEYPPVFVAPRHGFVQDIAVTAAWRRNGVGRALVEHTERWFAEQAVTRIELQVLAANEVSEAFWKRLGYGDYVLRLAKETLAPHGHPGYTRRRGKDS
jgi:ribosomal protein S18 acetylase RimI-like enzyme